MSTCESCGCNITLSVGEKGDTGATGATGATGSAGATGATGETGLGTLGIIDGTTATVALLEADTGSTLYFERATGVVVTLPDSPAEGTNYTFEVLTDVTSNAYTINTGGFGLDVIEGYLYGKKAATADELFLATTDAQISMNGTTSGGTKGTSFTLVHDGVSTWNVSGSF